MDDFEDDFDDDELDMFVDAQDTVWTAVLEELKAGQKQTHWMWFIFPQLADLGSSDMAKLYGMHDLAEAEAYLNHPILGSRLLEVAKLVLGHHGRTAEEIFGSLDASKLRSSMTLFSSVQGSAPEFQMVLERYFNGSICEKTDSAIR
jgi:uncharacterized protein (DUF1810 family)